jgi:hypothetical protein
VCGLQLRSIILLESCTIKQLAINLAFVGKELIPLIARAVAPSLSCLLIIGSKMRSSDCYEALDVFFVQCDEIRALRRVF